MPILILFFCTPFFVVAVVGFFYQFICFDFSCLFNFLISLNFFLFYFLFYTVLIGSDGPP